MASPVAKRFNARHLCPVCGTGSKGCSVTADGLHACRADGPADPAAWRKVADKRDGWRYYRSADEPLPERNGHHKKDEPAPQSGNWRAEAERYAANLTPALRADLAGRLGLPVEMLDVGQLIGVRSVRADGPIFTFPEFGGRGRCVGISLRLPTGKKLFVEGGSRGLSVPTNFRTAPGDIYIVEGPTCTTAVAGCGLACVGRFSDKGGADLLAELLRDTPANRRIIVVGENDEHEDKAGNPIWPGRAGAAHVATELSAKLGRRPVRIAFPPPEFKDSREFIRALLADCADAVDLQEIGRQFAAGLLYDPDPDVEEESESASRFAFLDADEFFAADYRPTWLVPRLLVRGQPGIIGGPSKTLKTSLMVDLAISVAAGVPFLGEFPVPNRVRVAIASGESGLHTLQETARRVAAARGVGDPGRMLKGWFHVSGTLPTLSDVTQMAEFEDRLAAIDAELILIDPLYLCLGPDVDEKSMFSMGNVLRSVTEIIQRTGRTIVIAHHSNGRLQVGEPMELSHLAYSGGAQYARQWILLNRRERYAGGGVHDLWMSIGGSVGHGGLWSLHIEEGVTGDDFNGRRWDVTVQSQDDVKAEESVEKKAAKSDAVRRRFREEETELFKAIDSEVSKGQPGATRTAISDLLGWARSKVAAVAGRLIEDGAIEEIPFEKPTGKNASLDVKGFRRVAQDDGR